MLIFYFLILGVLAVYGAYRIKQVIDFWRYRKIKPRPARLYAEHELPLVTVQLPLFNEVYVVERLLRAVTAIDYPRHLLEIQVLDDSADETQALARATVDKYREDGFDIHYVHRTDRTGFKAGALEHGLKTAKGDLLAIFDADFVPKPSCVRKLVHYFSDPLVACTQMRWSHINGSYNLLTRLQTIMLDGHFVIEQTVRNRTGDSLTLMGPQAFGDGAPLSSPADGSTIR
ncbi:MAG: glycosyltransferase [Pyrinomonadaceae bacterium]